jgi:uncharacterized phage-associated protein
MKSADEFLKIRAALLYVLSKFPQGVDYIKLFKILYFAQKQHLVTYGRVIVNDTFHADKHGPVPSFSYSALKAKERNSCTKDFAAFLEGITITNKNVKSSTLPDMDELSISDIECLDKSFKKYNAKYSYFLSGLSHDDAWASARKRKFDDPENDRMTVIEIAKAGKAKSGMIDYIRNMLLIKRSVSCG